jgi:hypothetical protein
VAGSATDAVLIGIQDTERLGNSERFIAGTKVRKRILALTVEFLGTIGTFLESFLVDSSPKEKRIAVVI